MQWAFRNLAPRGVGAVLLAGWASAGAMDLSVFDELIESGQWAQARREIERCLQQPGLAFPERAAVQFQLERMARIRLDFSKRRDEVFREAEELLPGLDPAQFDRWEREGAVECLPIDGTPWYLERAAGNLFRIHPEARARLAAHAGAPAPVPAHRLAHVRDLLRRPAAGGPGPGTSAAKSFRVRYRLTVKPGIVPAGELVRAWLPFPQRTGRQHGVRLIRCEPAEFLCSPEGRPLSSIYLEQPSRGADPTVFAVVFDYGTAAVDWALDAAQASASTPAADLAPYLREQPPHLVFAENVRQLSRELVGAETNRVRVARRLFQWVHEHIPWAGAREYSTLDSLTRYALARRHGDCGIQTMLFMSLCRLNGIPARWESGWTTGPDQNMHDWCAIHLEPWGWVPADVSFGFLPVDEERVRWFYLGGLDAYRLVVNTDFEQPLYPAKMHPRSELVDFQRGEVEWRGGNLYFNQWSYAFEVEDLCN